MIEVQRTGAALSKPPPVEKRRFLIISNSSAHETTARLVVTLADRLREQSQVAEVRLRAVAKGILPKIRQLARTEHEHVGLVRDADVLVVHSPLALSVPTLVAARVRRLPVLAFVWDLYPESNRVIGRRHPPALLGLFWVLERLGMVLSTRLLIATEDYRPFLGRFKDKASVVPMWPCDPVADVRTGPSTRSSSTLRIGFAGQVNSIRGLASGIEDVLESWSGDVELHLFSGDAAPTALVQKASGAGRLRLVEHGFLAPDQLQARLSGLDLGWVCLDPNFGLPAFPSKILAYLSAGLPVLYTGPPLPALHMLLDEHQLGVATRPGQTIDRDLVARLHRDLQRRRATYFAEICDLGSTLGRLL